MLTKSQARPVLWQTFLLDKAKKHSTLFASLQPEVVTSLTGLRNSLAHATKDSFWISYEKDLTEALLRNVSWPEASLGMGLFVHQTDPQTLPALTSCFRKFAFIVDGNFLPADELAEALEAENRADLFIGGSVDHRSQTITLWRGHLEPLTVPFTAFEKSGDGTEPDFKRFSVTDCGQTIRLGNYEAAADAVLYEYDADYRRRIAKQRRETERSFGASLRRLRSQRGLRREDFSPAVTDKTIARIEQGKVSRIHQKTLAAIAKRLGVALNEIESY